MDLKDADRAAHPSPPVALPGLHIRDADPARDAAGCAAIYAPFVAGTAVSFEETPLHAHQMEERIRALSRAYPWLVAERGGDIAGYAYGSPHREREGYRWAVDVAVYVADGHRGQRVGTALYARLLPLLTRQGLFVACAGITLPNPASVALHESLGFRLVGVYEQIGWKAGAWRDVGWWQCQLARASDVEPPSPGPPVRLDAEA